MHELTDVDTELAVLVRERLDAREPRLPARFVPPPERPVRRRWVTAMVVAAFVLGVGFAMLIRPALNSTVLSGVLGLQPVPTPTPAVSPPQAPRGIVPGLGTGGRPLPSATGSPGPSPSPDATPTPESAGGTPAAGAGTPAPGPTSTAQPTAPVTIQVSLPPLLPTPTATPHPTPTATPICILGIVCVKT